MQADRPGHRAAGIVAACGLAAILSAAPSGGTGPADDPFDAVVRTVLSEIALKRADLGYDPAVFSKYPVPADEDCRLSWIADILSDPMQIPAFSYDLVRPIRANPHSLANVIAVAAAALDQPTSEHPDVSSASLTDAIAAARQSGGAVGPIVAQLLESVQLALALRQEALSGLTDEQIDSLYAKSMSLLTSDTADAVVLEQLNGFAYPKLFSGARIIAEAVEEAVPKLRAAVATGRAFEMETDLGKVIVSGPGDDRHEDKALLRIDLGGNDTHAGAAGVADAKESPISIVIDLAGNDVYSGSAAHGLLGIGLLYDCGGDDTYDGVDLTQGVGVFGVGAVCDYSGNDSYVATDIAQGAGLYGIGAILDAEGDDHYTMFTYGQGMGYVRGAGFLVDTGGDDIYRLRDDELKHASPQDEKHNVSMGQGAGYGRRADSGDKNSRAGGLGVLLDLEGSDIYTAGVFSQGSGYWFGFGLLWDCEGNDEYTGHWYAQSSSAHFAASCLVDESGHDRYITVKSQGIGSGRDLSNSFFLDLHGNDVYEGSDRSLGVGDLSGSGFFVDLCGDDQYIVSQKMSLGRGRIAKENMTDERFEMRKEKFLSLGVMVDCGGKDTYSRDVGRNNSTWNQVTDQKVLSFGADIERPLSVRLWPED